MVWVSRRNFGFRIADFGFEEVRRCWFVMVKGWLILSGRTGEFRLRGQPEPGAQPDQGAQPEKGVSQI